MLSSAYWILLVLALVSFWGSAVELYYSFRLNITHLILDSLGIFLIGIAFTGFALQLPIIIPSSAGFIGVVLNRIFTSNYSAMLKEKGVSTLDMLLLKV